MAYSKDVTFFLHAWFQLVLSGRVKGRTALLFSVIQCLIILRFIQCFCRFLKKTASSHVAVRKFWNMTPRPCRTPFKPSRVRYKDSVSRDESGLKGADTRRLLLANTCVLERQLAFVIFPPFSTAEADVVVWFMMNGSVYVALTCLRKQTKEHIIVIFGYVKHGLLVCSF